MTAVWFVLAAATGGVGRHLVAGRLVAWRASQQTCLAALTVNVAGSFVLGLLLGADTSDEVLLVVGTAACGSFTTFGTFVLQALEAGGPRRVAILSANVLGPVAAATIGWWLA